MKRIQKKYRDLQAEDMARIICRVAEGQKALDVVALDVRELSGFADYFVIMGGTSTRHVQGLADVIGREIASKRLKTTETEGLSEGEWILLDYNDVIVHIFHHEIRAHYDLEGLWHDAPRIDLSQPAPVVEEPVLKKPKKKSPTRKMAVKETEGGAKKPARLPARKITVAPAKPGKKGAAPVAGKPAGKAGKPTRRPIAKPAGRTGKPTVKPTGRSAAKPAARAGGKASTSRRGGSGGAKK